MSLFAILNNLAKLTSLGLLNTKSTDNEAPHIIEKLQKLHNDTADEESRVHPFQVLHTLETYRKGKQDRGKLKWVPNAFIIDALENAFPLSFKNVEATQKRFLVAVDVDASSPCHVIGSTWLSPVMAAAAMVMLVARTEPQFQLVTGSETISPVEVTPEMSLAQITQALSQGQNERKTRDSARPLVWATENKKTVDAFLVLTDGDTSQHSVHPRDAIKSYREQLNIPNAKLVMCGLTDAKLCVADSADLGMLDVRGFDVEAPRVIHNFVSGNL